MSAAPETPAHAPDGESVPRDALKARQPADTLTSHA